MKRSMIILSLLLLPLGCSLGDRKPAGLNPPGPRAVAREHDAGDQWYYNPRVRILSDALTARLQPVPSAAVTAEAAQEEDCREVQVTNPADDTAGGYMQNEVSLAVAGDAVVVTYNDDNDARVTMSGFGWSADGGVTFTDGGAVLPPGQAFGGGDPFVLADPANPSRFLYFELTYYGNPKSSILMHESLDAGRTFPVEQARDILKGLAGPIGGKPLEAPAFFHDKEWGVWSPVNNALALAWDVSDNAGNMVPVAIVSRDGGQTFGPGLSLLGSGGRKAGGLTAAAAGPNGELYVAYNEFYSATLWVARSLDGGDSWEGPYLAVGTFQAPFNTDATKSCQRTALKGEIRITSVPSMAADPATGDLYMVYNYKESKTAPDDSDIAFVKSTDRGATWSTPVKINDDATPSDQFMPSVASVGGGNVAVAFYDRRDDPSNLNMHIYLAQSLDGGATWIKNRRITCKPSPPAPTSCYMGDYIQIVPDGVSYLMAWGDNRNTIQTNGQDMHNPDAFFARVHALPKTRPLTKP